MNSVFNQKIGIVGTGNVAWHLCRLCTGSGVYVSGVLVRNKEKARAKGLYSMFNVPLEDDLQRLVALSDILLIAVNDPQISVIAEHLKDFNGLVCHTSGSVALSSLSSKLSRAGVFYPLQTLTKGIPVPAADIPFCLETVHDEDLEILFRLSETIGSNACKIDSAQRIQLHIAAIFACNFSHHMIACASKWLDVVNLNFEMMIPLLKEQARKMTQPDIQENQTGPARRGDLETISRHLSMLDASPELRELYQLISDSILKMYHHKK